MTPQQIKNKIDELKFWLEHNHSHSEVATVQKDLRELESQLADSENAKEITVTNPKEL